MSENHIQLTNHKEPEPKPSEILAAINDFSTQIEERFATKDDLKLELQRYATKDDLKNDLKSLENTLVTKLDRILVNTERLEIERVAHVAWLQRHDEQFKKLLPQV